MTIAVVTPEFPTETSNAGGLSNYSYRLCRALKELGHLPQVFVYSDIDEDVEYNGIPVHRVKLEHYDNKIYFSTNPVFKLYAGAKKFLLRTMPAAVYYNMRLLFRHYSKQLNDRVLEAHKVKPFDIIHYAHLGAVGYCRIKDVPCVARLSSSTSEIEKFGGFGGNINEVEAQEQIELDALKKMNGVFGPSRTIAAKVSKQIGMPVEIIESPYLPETNRLDNSVYEKELSNKKYLLFFGHISLIKGAGTIGRMIRRFLEKYSEYSFVFIGKPLASEVRDKNMLEYLREQAGPFADRVIHIKNLPHTQLYPILQHAQFCVLPSRIDNFPNTCIEAMAHGKIVIGTRGNGFEQLISDGVSGFLVEVDDEQGLYDSITRVLELSDTEKKQIEAAAMKRIEQLRPEVVIQQLVRFYQKNIDNFKK